MATSRTKWAYTTSKWPQGFDVAEAAEAFDLLGSDGWELITSVTDHVGHPGRRRHVVRLQALLRRVARLVTERISPFGQFPRKLAPTG